MQFRDPVLGFCEGRGLRDVVDDEGGLGVAIVHGGEGGEAFLACGVPDFEFDGPRWQVALLREESGCFAVRMGKAVGSHTRGVRAGSVHLRTAYRGLLVLLEVIVDEAHNERRLRHQSVPAS